jgi:hypothetical protein
MAGTDARQGDSVTATIGEVVVTPVPYHSFRVGPYSATVTVKEGESLATAFERAQGAAKKIAVETYREALAFWSKEWRVER